MPQFANMTSLPIFFDVVLFILLSLVTSPSFMSISSLVLELWKFTFKRDLPNIQRLGRVRDTKFGMDVSNEMLLNAAKYQSYSFDYFGVIMGKSIGSKVIPPPLRVNFSELGFKQIILHDVICIYKLYFKSERIHLGHHHIRSKQKALSSSLRITKFEFFKNKIHKMNWEILTTLRMGKYC